mmetsp:Transcript_43246/g.104545  ORF Transcript_43246/g.104545 Transcript_43246/m.104545 type:complete len:113 (-) Transcript_43246:1140-1478(-)
MLRLIPGPETKEKKLLGLAFPARSDDRDAPAAAVRNALVISSCSCGELSLEVIRAKIRRSSFTLTLAVDRIPTSRAIGPSKYLCCGDFIISSIKSSSPLTGAFQFLRNLTIV